MDAQPPTPNSGSGSSWGAPPDRPPVSWQSPPEEIGPAPGYAFGGFGERLIAYIVDGFIAAILVTVVALVGVAIIAGGAASGSAAAAGVGGLFIFLAAIVISFAYFPWFWAHGGQTPGMRMFGLRVVRDGDGGPIGGGQAILRFIGYIVSGSVFYLGYIWIFIDKRKRGWHDLIAGTVVVKRV